MADSLNLCRVVFYVLPLNRFTVEEAEESVSNVTAEKKKLPRLPERLHFGELNQLNGCGRADREAGCVRRAEELSGKRLGFSHKF